MSYQYLMPKSFPKTMNYKIHLLEEPEKPQESYGFEQKLNDYRNQIDSINASVWKKVRWYINDYDFLVKDPIINRAFYKYWEIINEFDIFDNYNSSDIILHCAEAPGGFIQGSNIFLQLEQQPEIIVPLPPKYSVDDDGFMTLNKKKKNKKEYKIYTISLNKDLPQYKSYNLPSYNRNVINKYVHVTYGKDNSGDINNPSNIDDIITLTNKKKFYLITADGGFDEGTDFNNKEQLHFRLILSEVYSAITLQKQGGNFILKLFDIFTVPSIQILYLLSMCYSEVYVYKPKTSRPTNSEKYIICKNFCLSSEIQSDYTNTLNSLIKELKSKDWKYTSFNLFDNLPDEFRKFVKNVNKCLLENQCSYLDQAIELCNSETFVEKYDSQINELIEKRKLIFKNWEENYNLNSFV
jgi:23S rRNA U2552 (ribose-2'-O)-methylase RlmE/FtsJ